MEHQTKATHVVSITSYGECNNAGYPCHHMVDIQIDEKEAFPVHVRTEMTGEDVVRLHRLCALQMYDFHFQKYIWVVRKEPILDRMSIRVETNKTLVVVADKESDEYRDRVYRFRKEERMEIESRILQENKKMEQARKNILELTSLLK